MKKQIMKSLIAASMMLAMLFGGNAAFANGTNGKTNNGATKKVAAKHPKTVRISVSKDGFSPSSINVEEGYPVTLVFTRKDKKTAAIKSFFHRSTLRKTCPSESPLP